MKRRGFLQFLGLAPAAAALPAAQAAEKAVEAMAPEAVPVFTDAPMPADIDTYCTISCGTMVEFDSRGRPMWK